MHATDKDTNPWSGALDHSHNSGADIVGGEPQPQTEPSDAAPAPQATPPIATVASLDTLATNESPRAAAQVPREREVPLDPQVASLRALFPDFDDAVL
jgi:hypothetical protein